MSWNRKAIWDATGTAIVGYVDDPEADRRESEAWAQINDAQERAEGRRLVREREAREAHERDEQARQDRLESWTTSAALEDYAYGGSLKSTAEPNLFDLLVARLPEFAGRSRAEPGALDAVFGDPDPAALQHIRRAEDLLARQLLPEVEREYRAALQIEPYESAIFYRLGQLAVLSGREADAAREFGLAQRYGRDRPLVAAASLMAAACHERLGQRDERQEALARGCDLVDDCPELWLAAARAGDGAALAEALALAPELVAHLPEQPLNDQAAERALAARHRAAAADALTLLATAQRLERQLSELGVATDRRIAVPGPPAAGPARELAWTLHVRGELARAAASIHDADTRLGWPDRPTPPSEPRTPLEQPPGTAKRIAVTTLLVLLAPGSIGLTLVVLYFWWRGVRDKDDALAALENAKRGFVKANEAYERRVAPFEGLKAAVRQFEAEAARTLSRPARTVPILP